jgi:hypothetical protein
MFLFSWGLAAVVALVAFVTACTWQPSATFPSEDDKKAHAAASLSEPIPSPTSAGSPSPPHAPIVELSLNEAIESAVDKLLAGAQSSPDSALEKRAVVINPLVQDKAGSQNSATRDVQSSIYNLIRIKYQNFDILPFTVSNLAKEPLVVIGTLAAIGKPEVEKEAYRLWLSLADLRSEKIVAKAQAYVKVEDIDLTPTAHFRDSPVWTYCPLTEGYISTCQETKVGDAIKLGYLERIAAEPVIIEAMDAYNDGRYADSLALYGSLMGTTQADQPRVYNGIYLAYWKLGRRDAMANAFGKLVDYGMRHGQLAVCFLFKPGSTGFWPNPHVSGPYEMWLEQIADRASHSTSCLEIVGHTSPTGPEPLNERLSLARAERIKELLMVESPDLKRTTFVTGVGSRENIIGTATDDARDALDRRVSFKVFSCLPKEPSN